MHKTLLQLFFLTCAISAMAQTKLYDEPYRPQFHFTPEKNWMNDPNGLVNYKGEYHLFYQYNPFGNSWGHMSWGHAVSSDLVHWKHLPVALAEENGVMIFSGSAVVDWNNSSGLCKSSDPKDKSCLIAIYTGDIEGKNQSQHIAASNDRGRTWTKFAGNPVLDIGYKDFRDPKVFWHEATKKWVMVVSLSREQKVRLYGSKNLQQWELLSEFGGAGVADKEVQWECPDLFELPIQNQLGKKRWVLIVNINPGGAAGGSAGQYFVGNFDGKTFTNDNPKDTKLFVDYGKDFYAGVTFSDIPKTDGRRILLGWMSNWDYAGKEPTTPWRTAQSIPRELKLQQTPAGLRLLQTPIIELQKLRGAAITKRNLVLTEKMQSIASGETIEMHGEFAVEKNASAFFRLQSGSSETLIGYENGQMFIDRTKSDNVDFDPQFTGRHEVSLQSQQGKIKLHVFVDRSSVEVFGNDGAAVLTDRIFPNSSTQNIELRGAGKCLALNIWQLKSIWK